MGWQIHENFIPSESWHRYSLPPSLMMLRAGAQQVEDQGRPAVWSSGWDWRCSSSTTPSSSCDFLPSRWGLLQGFNLNKQTNKQSEVVYLQWSWFHDWLTQLFASWFFLDAIMCKIAFTHSWLLYRQAILLEVRSILQTLNTHRRNSVSIPELLLHTHRIKESSGWTLLLLFV